MRGEKRPLATPIAELDKSFTLMATGEGLTAAVAAMPDLWQTVDTIRIFARMTPQGKATVIRELQKQGAGVLMCGDGGNDVGALKQADVGLALLADYTILYYTIPYYTRLYYTILYYCTILHYYILYHSIA